VFEQNSTPLLGANATDGFPGWKIRLNIIDGGNGYDFRIEDLSDKKCGYASISDESGIIRQSKTLDCDI
jgi:hypothetical protein